jgi:hypothetical protein
VVGAQHGWWSGCKELNLPGFPNDEANINCCISSEELGKELGTPTMRGLLCKIYPVKE